MEQLHQSSQYTYKETSIPWSSGNCLPIHDMEGELNLSASSSSSSYKLLPYVCLSSFIKEPPPFSHSLSLSKHMCACVCAYTKLCSSNNTHVRDGSLK